MKINLISLWLLALLFLACQVKCSEARVGFSGYWGGWVSYWIGSDSYNNAICGAELRFEPHQGSGDDTAANGLKLILCSRSDWNQQIWDSFDGMWGDWMGTKMCPYGQWVTKFRIRAEAPLGSNGDDTALNGLEIYCQDIALQNQSYVMVYEGLWGDWTEWYSVPNHLSNRRFFFIRAYLRFENARIWGGDDTALNGIEMEEIAWDI